MLSIGVGGIYPVAGSGQAAKCFGYMGALSAPNRAPCFYPYIAISPTRNGTRMQESAMHSAYFPVGRSQRFWLRFLSNVVMVFMLVVGLIRMFSQFRMFASFHP